MNAYPENTRTDGRQLKQLRPISIVAGTNPHAEGSAEVLFGQTKVMVTATVDPISNTSEKVAGILTTLSILPRATHMRIDDEQLASALQSELKAIENLIERTLRTTLVPSDIGKLAFRLNCCVLYSDAGIATASVAGCWVALYQALRWAALNNHLRDDLDIKRVAALSAGLINGEIVHDLTAEEAGAADFTATAVFNDDKRLVDLRGTHEQDALDVKFLPRILEQSVDLTTAIFSEQERAVLEMS